MKNVITFSRSIFSLALFVIFGVGGILFTPVVILLVKKEYCATFLRFLWWPLLKMFVLTGLISVDSSRLQKVSGTVIVANHPSLIDVVIMEVTVPKTFFVARHTLKKNPFMAAMVKMVSLPDDERLVVSASKYLAKGWNVLIFPEGSRSPKEGGLWPFKRGAAQVALRANAPILPLCIAQSPFRILGKHQWAWQMGSKRVKYELIPSAVIVPSLNDGESMHAASRRITTQLQDITEKILKGDK